MAKRRWRDAWDPHEPWDPPQYYIDQYDSGYEGGVVMYPCYGFSKDIMSECRITGIISAIMVCRVNRGGSWSTVRTDDAYPVDDG